MEPAVVMTDLEGRVSEWNPGAERLYGWGRDEAVGAPLADLVGPAGSHALREVLRAVSGGREWEGRLGLRRKDGAPFVVWLRATPLRDGDGALVGILALSQATDAPAGDELAAPAPYAPPSSPRPRASLVRKVLAADPRTTLLGLAVGLGGVGLATFVLTRFDDGDVRPGTAGFVFLLFVAAATLVGRFVAGAATAVAGALLIASEFVAPFGTLTITDQTAIAAIVMFLVASVVLSILIAQETEARAHNRADAARVIRLGEASAALAAADTTDAVADAILGAGAVLEADATVLVRLDESDTIRLVAQRGLAPGLADRYREFSLHETTPLGEALRTGRTVVVDAAERERRFPGLPATWGVSVSAPLHGRDGVIGGLGLRFASVRRLSDAERGFIGSLAAQASVALERARLAEDERRARDALSLLAEASERLTASLDADRLVAALADLAVPGVADVCVVDLLEGDHVVRAAVRHRSDPQLAAELEGRPPELHEAHPVWRTLRDGRPRLYDDADRAFREAFESGDRRRLVERAGIRSAMVVPLRSGDAVLGAMILASAGRRYGEDELELAEDLGRRAGVALSHASAYRTAQSERATLDAVLRQLPVGVTIAEAPSGRVLATNDAARRIWRGALDRDAAGDYVGLRADGTRYRDEDWPLSRAVRGETVESEEVRLEFRDGTATILSASATPIRDAGGAVVAAVVSLFDLTELKQNEARLRFLSEASDLLAESLDYRTQLERLAFLVVPTLADWCSITVRDGGELRNVGVAHRDPEKVAYARELQKRYPPRLEDRSGVANVIRTGRTEYTPEMSEEILEAVTDDPNVRGIVRELGLRSAITAPLSARGRTFGALTVIHAESGRRYSEIDVELVEELSHRAGLAIDNARLYGEQADIARTLQNSLLPAAIPPIAGLRADHLYEPAGAGTEVGGDFFDVWRIMPPRHTDDLGFGVAIGDVCGKGAAAAALTSLTRHTVRTASLFQPTPSIVLEALHDAIRRRVGGERFVTVAYGYGVPRAEGGFDLTVGLGGHPAPFLVRPDGTVTALGRPGTLLGVFDTVEFHDCTYRIEPGDLVVMWTDGVSERRGPDGQFGEKRLVEVLRAHAGRSAADVRAGVEQALRAFAPGRAQDDTAVVVLEATRGAGAAGGAGPPAVAPS